MSLYSAEKRDFWTIELLGGENDGYQISVAKKSHPNFPPSYWQMPSRDTRSMLLEISVWEPTPTPLTYKMHHLRWIDNVFVYELVRG